MSNEHITIKVTKRTFFGVSCMIIGALAWNAATALADGSTATQSVVGSDLIMPYDGYLMVDSAPLTGTRTIKFDLYQVATGGTAVWTETQTVNLYNGRFSVGLGSANSLTSTILDAEKLYLTMTIVETDANGNTVEVELSGRQAIEPAPFAAWAANSADFNVDGALDVAGTATLNGTTVVNGTLDANSALDVAGTSTLNGGLTAKGSATITGSDNDGSTAALMVGRDDGNGGMIIIDDDELDNTSGTLAINKNSGNEVDIGGALITRGNHTAYGKYLPKYSNWDNSVGDGDASIVNDNGSYKALMIHGNKSADGSTRVTKLWDDIEVQGVLSNKGNAVLNDAATDTTTVNGSLTVNGGFTNFYTNTYAAEVYGVNNGGTQRGRVNIGTTTNRICMLKDWTIVDHDDGDLNSCRILLSTSGSIYHLDAYAEGGGNTYTYCEAVCFGW